VKLKRYIGRSDCRSTLGRQGIAADHGKSRQTPTSSRVGIPFEDEPKQPLDRCRWRGGDVIIVSTARYDTSRCLSTGRGVRDWMTTPTMMAPPSTRVPGTSSVPLPRVSLASTPHTASMDRQNQSLRLAYLCRRSHTELAIGAMLVWPLQKQVTRLWICCASCTFLGAPICRPAGSGPPFRSDAPTVRNLRDKFDSLIGPASQLN